MGSYRGIVYGEAMAGRRGAMTDRHKQQVESLLNDWLMDATKSYLERGRRFASLGPDDLEARWLEALRQGYAIGDQAWMQEEADLAAEMRLRGLDHPPVPQEIMDAVQRRVTASTEEDHERVVDAIREYRERFNKPKN
jgi:hypothetical protein